MSDKSRAKESERIQLHIIELSHVSQAINLIIQRNMLVQHIQDSAHTEDGDLMILEYNNLIKRVLGI